MKYSKNVNQLCHGDYGQNMLHYFLVTGTANTVGLPMLIDAGVDLNAKDALGMTPCNKALMVHHGCLLQLLEAGSDPTGVAETLEHWAGNLPESQRLGVDDPLIKWFREHGREIRPIKSKDTKQIKIRTNESCADMAKHHTSRFTLVELLVVFGISSGGWHRQPWPICVPLNLRAPCSCGIDHDAP